MNDPLENFISHIGLSQDQLSILKKEQEYKACSLQNLLLSLGYISKDDLLNHLSSFFEIPYVNLGHYAYVDDQEINREIEQFRAFAFSFEDENISIALEDAIDIDKKDQIRKKLLGKGCNKPIEWFYGNYDQIKNQKKINGNDYYSIISDDFYFYLKEAVHIGASDIHIKCFKSSVTLFYRINGALISKKTWHKEEQGKLINKLKVLASLDIAQKRVAQSGHFEYVIDNRLVHFRTSSHPTIQGESIAIRILDLNEKRKTLHQLGIQADHHAQLEKSLQKKEGLILLSGTTGSGKTTTLYACLDFLARKNLNIVTLEDPVESYLDYALQTEISESFSYHDGVRSILRQDPNIILVGEIRDEETAKIVFRAAMTGHLILSTIHAKSINHINLRLNDLGISQNLVENFLTFSMFQELIPIKHDPCFGKGCGACLHTGILTRKLKTSIIS